jgi:hypothetical protein
MCVYKLYLETRGITIKMNFVYSSEDKAQLTKLVEAVKTNFNDRADEVCFAGFICNCLCIRAWVVEMLLNRFSNHLNELST